MTAPSPRPDVLAVLDQLDALHEEWRTLDGRRVDTTNGTVWNELFRAPHWMDDDEVRALVAEHNALPQLTAAVRAVHALHQVDEDTDSCLACNHALDKAGHCPTLRVLAALTPDTGDGRG